MTEAEQSAAAKQLRRLRDKAELCRYSNERMRDAACFWRRATNCFVATLSFMLSVLAAMLYREVIPGAESAWLGIVVILPPLILLVQGVSGIFGWAEQESECAAAIHIWGQWIREADFFEKNIPRLSEDALREGMDEMGRKYVACMEKAPAIPARKFLCYKVGYRQHRAISEKIDNASEDELAKIGRNLGCAKPEKN